jgi:hypothetical protein
MHLRKLMPLAELLEGGGRSLAAPMARAAAPAAARPAMPPPRAVAPSAPPRPAAPPPAAMRPAAPAAPPPAAAPAPMRAAMAPGEPLPDNAREQFLGAIKSAKVFFFNAVVAQAYKIDVTPAMITFAFLPKQKVPKAQCEENRALLEGLAEQTFGRGIPVKVTTVDGDPAQAEAIGGAVPAATAPRPVMKSPVATGAGADTLRDEAMANPVVRSMLEIFPVANVKIEEM